MIRPEFDEFYVKDLNEYNNTIIMLFEEYSEIYFRGVDQASYNLSPSISRKMPKNFTKEKEIELFNAFKRRLAIYKSETYMEYSGVNSYHELETLAIAQHHRLKTRMLDWSTNPLSSLWFACEKPTSSTPDNYCVVWVLTAPKNPISRNPFFAKEEDYNINHSIFKEDKTLMYMPNIVNPRIRNQCGLFSIHHFDEKLASYVPLDENRKFFPHKFKENVETYNQDIHWNLIKILVNRSLYVDKIKKNLRRFDVHEETIYPSLERAGNRLNFDFEEGWVY